MNLLNCKQLAGHLQVHPGYVSAMRRAGYKMLIEATNRTTIEHAAQWLMSNPDFRASDYMAKGWERLPKLSQEPQCLEGAAVGK